jgi:hypothetical protein
MDDPKPDASMIAFVGPDSEGAIAVSITDPSGRTSTMFVDALQLAEAAADFLERIDFGENPAR